MSTVTADACSTIIPAFAHLIDVVLGQAVLRDELTVVRHEEAAVEFEGARRTGELQKLCQLCNFATKAATNLFDLDF